MSEFALTPLIAVIVAFIAYRQARTDELRLKAELYDRRLRVYQAVETFILAAIHRATVTDKDFEALVTGSAQGYFLFQFEVADYIQTVTEKGSQLRRIADMLAAQPKSPEERSQLTSERAELSKWFGKQLGESRRLFARELHLG